MAEEISKDVTIISNEIPSSQQKKLVQLLENHQVALVCRNCHRNYDDTTTLLQHVQEGNCKPGAPTTEARADMVVSRRKRGRPRKSEVTSSSESLLPMKKPKYEDDANFVKAVSPSGTPRRATRCATGAIERKSVWDILGEKPRTMGDARTEEEEEVEEEEIESCDNQEASPKRGRGRPKKIMVKKEPISSTSVAHTSSQLQPVKRGRGRPRKNYLHLQPQVREEDGVKMVAKEEQKPSSDSHSEDTAEEAVSLGEKCETTDVNTSPNPCNSGDNPTELNISNEATDIPEDNDEASGSSEKKHINHAPDKPEGAELKSKKDEEKGDGENDDAALQAKTQDLALGIPAVTDLCQKENLHVDNALHDGIYDSIVNDSARSINHEPSDNINQCIQTKVSEQDGTTAENRTECTSETANSGVIKTPGPGSFKFHRMINRGGMYRPSGKRTSRDYKCPICKQRWFYTEEELELHVQCHDNPDAEMGYSCVSCDYKCTLWGRMLEHIAVHEDLKQKYMSARFFRNVVGQFPCPICGKIFSKKVNMKGHLSKVHYKQDHFCSTCGKTFERMDDKTFRRHAEKCQNMVFQCEHCPYKTSVSMNLRKHVKIHDGTGYPCGVCGTLFPTRQRCKVHELIHSDNRQKTMCEHCGKEFCSNDAVKRHVVRVHTEVLAYFKCSQCPFSAKLDTDLRKHINSVHVKKFKCETCPYQSNSADAFEQHKFYHDPNRRFACPYTTCYYRGLTSKQLSNHVSQVHRLTSRHQCPICHRMYKKKTHLVRHLVSHTEDKPYVCLECGEAYASHSLYYRHRRETGHDKGRTSGASVPQNITIQYVTTDMNFDFEGEANEEAVAAEALTGEALETNVLQGVVAETEVMEGEILQGEFVESVEAEASAQDGVAQEMDLQAIQELVGQENIITLEDEHGEKITYVLQMEEDQSMNVEATTDAMVGLEPEHQAAVDELVSAETTIEEPTELVEDVVAIDDNQVGEVQAVVEVSPPGSDCQQYAILVLPQSDAENEAALSMLQLQPSEGVVYKKEVPNEGIEYEQDQQENIDQ